VSLLFRPAQPDTAVAVIERPGPVTAAGEGLCRKAAGSLHVVLPFAVWRKEGLEGMPPRSCLSPLGGGLGASATLGFPSTPHHFRAPFSPPGCEGCCFGRGGGGEDGGSRPRALRSSILAEGLKLVADSPRLWATRTCRRQAFPSSSAVRRTPASSARSALLLYRLSYRPEVVRQPTASQTE
jgi:hypothetical protein